METFGIGHAICVQRQVGPPRARVRRLELVQWTRSGTEPVVLRFVTPVVCARLTVALGGPTDLRGTRLVQAMLKDEDLKDKIAEQRAATPAIRLLQKKELTDIHDRSALIFGIALPGLVGEVEAALARVLLPDKVSITVLERTTTMQAIAVAACAALDLHPNTKIRMPIGSSRRVSHEDHLTRCAFWLTLSSPLPLCHFLSPSFPPKAISGVLNYRH